MDPSRLGLPAVLPTCNPPRNADAPSSFQASQEENEKGGPRSCPSLANDFAREGDRPGAESRRGLSDHHGWCRGQLRALRQGRKEEYPPQAMLRLPGSVVLQQRVSDPRSLPAAALSRRLGTSYTRANMVHFSAKARVLIRRRLTCRWPLPRCQNTAWKGHKKECVAKESEEDESE